MSNTIGYRAAHGVVEGQEYSVLIGATKFIIPAGVLFDVYTSGDIKPHHADRLHLYISMARHLDLGSDLGLPSRLGQNIVRVEVRGQKEFSSENSIFYSKDGLSNPEFRLDIGLIRYVRLLPLPKDHSVIYLYRSIERASIGLFPQYAEFHCSVVWANEKKENGVCRTTFYMPELVVQAFFSYSLLSHWQIVLNEVCRAVVRYKK